MTPLEAIARAICEARCYPGTTPSMPSPFSSEADKRAARAALNALASNISEGMLVTGGRIVAGLSSGRAIEPYEDDARDAFVAMLQRAKEEG